MLAAGMKGVEEKYQLPEPVEENIYEMSLDTRNDLNIGTLPGSLMEAIREMRNSALVKETLGEHIFDKFIENKLIEWQRYRAVVTNYEIEKYLPVM
jgi:glutamine synthetase